MHFQHFERKAHLKFLSTPLATSGIRHPDVLGVLFRTPQVGEKHPLLIMREVVASYSRSFSFYLLKRLKANIKTADETLRNQRHPLKTQNLSLPTLFHYDYIDRLDCTA